ncbi:MAG TPA: hypothetical protein VM889_10000 [Candidatus Thermoplasmatota archaeon]|nr:hypothetical protein [Candidatus Thermoplasmatota archaeon]
MKAWRIAAFALSSLLGLATVASAIDLATAPEDGPEKAFATRGWDVIRTASPLAWIGDAARDPDAVVVAGRRIVLDAERAVLWSYAERGGDVWILSSDPSLARRPGASEAPRVLAGIVHGVEDAKAPVLSKGITFGASGLLAIDPGETGFDPIALATGRAYRDTNDNARLDAGEPAGPFAVAVAARHGEGRVVFVAASRPGRLEPEALEALVDPPTGDARLVYSPDPSARPIAAAGLFALAVADVAGRDLAMLAAGAAVLVACALALVPARDPREDVSLRLVADLLRETPADIPLRNGRDPPGDRSR